MMGTPEPSHWSTGLERDNSEEIQFSRVLTLFCGVVCVCGFALLLWSVSSTEEWQESATASRDLERLASRLLSIESRIPELSRVEQAMFLLWGAEGETQEQFRQWYKEVPPELRYPLDELYAGILNGEAKLNADLTRSFVRWDSVSPPFSIFRALLETVYLDHGQSKTTDFHMLQAQLAEEVPANWFYFQVAKRLAEQSGDQALRDHLHRQFQQFTDPPLWKWRTLVLLELSIVGIGLLCLVYVASVRIRNQRASETRAIDQAGSLWTLREGLSVLVRGGALSIGMVVLMAVTPNGPMLLEQYGSLFLYLPTVFVAVVFLCRPKKQSLLKLLGCQNGFQSVRSSFPLLLGVMALGVFGDWVIMLGGEVWQMSAHWTEWFLPQLVWGSQGEVLKLIIEIVLLAPIFEEVIFRGILYSTLRAKLSVPVSVVGSAAIFASAHGYGVVAFLSVFWSGLLWAWLYERTGSVVPGMCAHAINNGLVVATLMVLFRS